MLEYGFLKATEEITLVVFTTFGPAGVFAFCFAGLYFAFCISDSVQRTKAEHYLVVPLAVTLASLIASATHLGNPNNALYVLSGIGSSPLSNEVSSGLLFLGTAGAYWLATFMRRNRLALRRACMCIVSGVGVLFLVMIAMAYSVNTIPSWDTMCTPLMQGAFAANLGAFLVLLTMRWAEASVPLRLARALLGIVATSVVAGVIFIILWGMQLPRLNSLWPVVLDIMPAFLFAALAYAVCQALALICVASAARRHADGRRTRFYPFVACALSGVGIFAVRFMFYITYMNVGLP